MPLSADDFTSPRLLLLVGFAPPDAPVLHRALAEQGPETAKALRELARRRLAEDDEVGGYLTDPGTWVTLVLASYDQIGDEVLALLDLS